MRCTGLANSSGKNPGINLGANLSAVADCEVTLNGGYAVKASATRAFDKKCNLFPVPSERVKSNANCAQNLGWQYTERMCRCSHTCPATVYLIIGDAVAFLCPLVWMVDYGKI